MDEVIKIVLLDLVDLSDKQPNKVSIQVRTRAPNMVAYTELNKMEPISGSSSHRAGEAQPYHPRKPVP